MSIDTIPASPKPPSFPTERNFENVDGFSLSSLPSSYLRSSAFGSRDSGTSETTSNQTSNIASPTALSPAMDPARESQEDVMIFHLDSDEQPIAQCKKPATSRFLDDLLAVSPSSGPKRMTVSNLNAVKPVTVHEAKTERPELSRSPWNVCVSDTGNKTDDRLSLRDIVQQEQQRNSCSPGSSVCYFHKLYVSNSYTIAWSFGLTAQEIVTA
jgi:hypothetical protein